MAKLRWHLGGLLAVDASVLVLLRGTPAAALRAATTASAWTPWCIDRTLATLAAAGLWCVAAWLGVGLGCVAAARLPGMVGAWCGWLGRRLLPRVVLRIVAGSAGLSVFLAPVAAAADPSPPPAPLGTTVTAGPAWPTAPPPQVGAPRWPTTTPRSNGTAGATPASTRTARRAPGTTTDDIRVRPGDSLWLLAAQRLGPDATDAAVAAEWPRWYAANRRVIGADPAVIRPGQVLHAPTPEVR